MATKAKTVWRIGKTGGGIDCVIIGEYFWQYYRYYKAKATAQARAKHLRLYGGQTVRKKSGFLPMFRAVKTNKGWGVFQISPFEKYRIKATIKNMEKHKARVIV